MSRVEQCALLWDSNGHCQ